jgi:hypothetical protein
VDVLQSNSKFYYILTEGAGEGDNLMRIPITGNDTVLDALSQVRGLSRVSSKRIWIARPAPGRLGCEQVLPVDYAAITKGGDTATNYQVMPGDRVFVAQDEMIALRAVVDKLVGPFERFTGFLGLGISTTRSGQLMGRDFNRTRSGF